jgi:hypothetical protein
LLLLLLLLLLLCCVLLLPLPATKVKDSLWLQGPRSPPGLMVAGEDACPLCDKPFYGKQKCIRCSACDIRMHCVCLQLGEAELASLTMMGDTLYKCTACKALGSRSMDKTQVQLQESLPIEEGAVSSASSN